MTINDPRGTFIFLSALFWFITIFTARKIWRYIQLSYHCVPVLSHIKTKEELKESLQGECFEKVMFQNSLLQKYFHVLISENWVVMDGRLFSRNEIKKYIIYINVLFEIMNKLILYILMVKHTNSLVATNGVKMNFAKQKYQIFYIKYVR